LFKHLISYYYSKAPLNISLKRNGATILDEESGENKIQKQQNCQEKPQYIKVRQSLNTQLDLMNLIEINFKK
jgi:hypothetical protein